MSTMTITVSGQPQINFGATGREEILQNVRTIVSTIQGTAPLDRELGIDGSAIDRPPAVARALLSASIIRTLFLKEPRVRVEQVTFDEQETPERLVPAIKLQFVDESEVTA